jgi:hypothetical protein
MRERSPGSDGSAEATDHTGAWRRRDEIRARFVMPAMDWATEHLEVGPGGICFLFCPNSLCSIPKSACYARSMPNCAHLCPMMPTNFPQTRR